VRDAFERNFEINDDIGAGFALYVEGELVVDLVGGEFEPGGKPYGTDALQLVFSTTKGATAIAAHQLVERGLLDFDAPVTDYWPEFGAAGKADVPVRWLLCHKAGLPDIDREMSYEDALAWDPVVDALAESAPLWDPGTQHGYHAVTYGWLVGELIRRVSGKSLGQYFADEVAAPLDIEFWIGTPDEEHHRVPPLIPLAPPEGMDFGTNPDGSDVGFIEMLDMLMGPGNLITRALCAPGGAMRESETAFNDPSLWRAEIGAAGGITNAPSLAKLYASTVSEVDGVRILQPDTVKVAMEQQTSGADAVLMFEIPFALGFMKNGPLAKLGSDSCFGHYGLGGSVGFADVEKKVGFGYVMNQTQLGLAGDPRTASLIDTVYAAL
jgi:CubicO group peptidase (beta-lactamase class C family)